MILPSDNSNSICQCELLQRRCQFLSNTGIESMRCLFNVGAWRFDDRRIGHGNCGFGADPVSVGYDGDIDVLAVKQTGVVALQCVGKGAGERCGRWEEIGGAW